VSWGWWDTWGEAFYFSRTIDKIADQLSHMIFLYMEKVLIEY